MPTFSQTQGREASNPAERILTAAEMRRRISVRFGRSTTAVTVPEHLVFFEVAACEPGGARRVRQRRIDAVAVGMLYRTGYLIHGFEIKTSRADLRQELRDPTKAATGSAYCDRWWLALANISILRDDDDLPSGWGVIAASGRGLRVYREPEPLERTECPRFRAALLHAGQRVPGYKYAMGFQQGLQRGREVNQRLIDDAYTRGSHAGRWQAFQEVADKKLGQRVI